MVWLFAISLFLGADLAHADAMDLALSRLRVSAQDEGCSQLERVCADHEAFERLVSELAVASGPPISAAAHTVGPGGFAFTIHQRITDISQRSVYWQRGTEGDAADGEEGLNRAVTPFLGWTRLEARKGLPLGLELSLDAGHAWGTSMWAIGGRLKVALFEGFSTGAGAFPDVAVSVSTQGIVGARDLELFVHGLELTMSKPFLLFGRLQLAPIVAGQLLFVVADSAVVELATGLYESTCAKNAPLGTCGAELSKLERFRPLRQLRVRWIAGFQLEMDLYRFILTATFDAPASTLVSQGRAYGSKYFASQTSVSAGLGITF